MYWMIWIVLMIAIPLVAGIPFWKTLLAPSGNASDDAADEQPKA
jgi:hypothetical protein